MSEIGMSTQEVETEEPKIKPITMSNEELDNLLKPCPFAWDEEEDEEPTQFLDDAVADEATNVPEEPVTLADSVHEVEGADAGAIDAVAEPYDEYETLDQAIINQELERRDRLVSADIHGEQPLKIHHFNFLGEPMLVGSHTPPAHSLMYLLSDTKSVLPRQKKLIYSCLRRGLYFIDPIIVFLDDQLTMSALRELSGAALVRLATGRVARFYTAHGSWLCDRRESNEMTCVDGGDLNQYDPSELTANGIVDMGMPSKWDILPLVRTDAKVYNSSRTRWFRTEPYHPSPLRNFELAYAEETDSDYSFASNASSSFVTHPEVEDESLSDKRIVVNLPVAQHANGDDESFEEDPFERFSYIDPADICHGIQQPAAEAIQVLDEASSILLSWMVDDSASTLSFRGAFSSSSDGRIITNSTSWPSHRSALESDDDMEDAHRESLKKSISWMDLSVHGSYIAAIEALAAMSSTDSSNAGIDKLSDDDDAMLVASTLDNDMVPYGAHHEDSRSMFSSNSHAASSIEDNNILPRQAIVLDLEHSSLPSIMATHHAVDHTDSFTALPVCPSPDTPARRGSLWSKAMRFTSRSGKSGKHVSVAATGHTQTAATSSKRMSFTKALKRGVLAGLASLGRYPVVSESVV